MDDLLKDAPPGIQGYFGAPENLKWLLMVINKICEERERSQAHAIGLELQRAKVL